jgi:hypothetical protein
VPTEASIKRVPLFFPGIVGAGGVIFTTDFYLVRRLKMGGAIILLPLYAFMAWVPGNSEVYFFAGTRSSIGITVTMLNYE